MFAVSHGLSELNVTSSTSSVQALQGENATLNCRFSGYGSDPVWEVEVTWLRFHTYFSDYVWRVLTSHGYNEGRNSYAQKLTGTSGVLSDVLREGHAITFSNILQEDEGQYWCEVKVRTYRELRDGTTQQRLWRGNYKYITVTVKGRRQVDMKRRKRRCGWKGGENEAR